ncbi:MAG TPA: hypothetical protein VFU31_20965 [Candidatus Binatia bacterium]|nr:hypothetical protein [Candidatus Binatia bacterium]
MSKPTKFKSASGVKPYHKTEVVIFIPDSMSDAEAIYWIETRGRGFATVEAYLEPTQRFDELLIGERSFSA